MFERIKSRIESAPVALAADSSAGTPSGSAWSTKAVTRERRGTLRRRSQRVYLEMPVLVYGRGPDKEPFREQTRTLSVSAHGALILLATRVDPEQRLMVTNPTTEEKVECRVAYLGSTEEERTEVGLEFISPSPRFWRIVFPPEDWNPAERKRPHPRPT